MAYKILLPQKMMKDLYMWREFLGGPPIIQSVREAVSEFISKREAQIGMSIGDAANAIEGERGDEAPEEEE